MRPGDVVLKVAGAPITNTPQLLNAVAALKPNQTATVSVQRGNKPIDIQVTVGQRPPSRPVPASAERMRATTASIQRYGAAFSSAGACVWRMKICAAQMPTS